MSKLRIFGLGVIGLGAGSAYFHGGSWGIWFGSVCLVVGLVLIVASEVTSLVLKTSGAKANPSGRKPVQIVALVKGEVHVYQRDGKFQEVDDPNQTGFEFDVFTYGWLVHGAELLVGIDDLYLSLKRTDGSSKIAERIAGDLKNWHLRVEMADEEESDGSAVPIRTTPAGLEELDTAAPLKCGVAREGWLNFEFGMPLPQN